MFVTHTIVGYTTFGEGFNKLGKTFPPMKEHFDFAVMFWKMIEKLLAEGKVKTHPVAVREQGLQGNPDGIDDLRQQRVSAIKLVYRTADTPAIDVSSEVVG
ncbi:hypothetical protein MMC17_004344 [Xylographa soralifera]|nr:hypothetical protein [Xylographa soralifera]